MNNSKYIRGSEWRKWDLHIHTPKSIIQNYGGDTNEAWEKFITELESLPEEYKAVGINDYIFLDGYKKVLEYKANGRLKNIDLILPIIELRVDKFASLGDEAWKKVNLHIIFSNELTADEIEAQFINAIQHTIKISPDIEGVEFRGVATKESLSEIGRQIKATSTVNITGSDLKVGFWNIFFDYKTVYDIVNGYFKSNCLTAIGKTEWDTMRWDGSAALKKTIINTADFSFTALEKCEDYSKHVEALEKQKVRNCLLDCSDAHNFSDSNDKDRIGNSFTWLKADTTFEGLKQIANDRGRIFIGDKPPLLDRFENNKTKFIKSLAIKKVEGSTLSENWFVDFTLPLNHSMVAVIGNKGGGKSAIADTLGLLGNTPNYEFFSFLTPFKFRMRKPINKSDQFEAELTWEDDTADISKLSQNPNPSSIEKIKYIPQGFLERLCNRRMDEDDIFEPELRKVIFSHIPDLEKFETTGLNELIDYHTEILNEEIENIKREINLINKEIIELEKKESDSYKNSLEEKLKEKEAELAAHEATKPEKIEPPSDPDIVQQNKQTSETIGEKREQLKKAEGEIQVKESQLKILKLEIAELGKVTQSLRVFESQFQKLKTDIEPTLTKNNLQFDQIVTVKLEGKKVQDLIDSKTTLSQRLETELGNNNTGLLNQKLVLSNEINVLSEKLDEHSKKFEKYINDLKRWEEKKSFIIGSADKDDTINYIKAQLEYLQENLAKDLEVVYQSRMDIIKKLFNKKEEVIQLYKSLFKPVSDFINTYGEILENYSINLDVDYKINGLTEKFFDHISLGAKGSFIGNPLGIERLNHIIENHNLKTEGGIINFLREMIDNLKTDQREDFEGQKREIEKQLKKGYSVTDLYTFLFGLDYLEPEYKLKLGEKSIAELSPGERGALLLIFYLTLDKSDIPLVIDQPEENLDNQSVFKILVQFIKKAKEKRQIIIVTHNPNLAVACSAEQIVHVNIDKTNGNTVEFESGSLENPIINDAVIDILEGTFPALNTRTSTYKVIKRPY